MTSIHKPIDQQVVVITGASSGIGLATAVLAAERGARLVLAARSGDTLEELTRTLCESGATAAFMVVDVGRCEEVEALARFAIAQFARIDTWINNAGVSIYGRLETVDEADSRRLFDTNFWGVVNGSLAALPHLRAHGGALINIGSEVSEAVLPLQGMYSASKHAVKGFTDALRIEVESLDHAPVSITLIQPTAADTPFPQHARNYLDGEPALPRPQLDPMEVAHVILQAACQGGRDVKVGAMARLNTAISRWMPALADRLAARQASRQQLGVPPQQPQGALHAAGGRGRIRGNGISA